MTNGNRKEHYSKIEKSKHTYSCDKKTENMAQNNTIYMKQVGKKTNVDITYKSKKNLIKSHILYIITLACVWKCRRIRTRHFDVRKKHVSTSH